MLRINRFFLLQISIAATSQSCDFFLNTSISCQSVYKYLKLQQTYFNYEYNPVQKEVKGEQNKS